MDIKSNTSTKVSAYNNLSLNTVKKTVDSDVKSSLDNQERREAGEQVTISEAARANEALPPYLQPINARPDPNASSGSVYDFLKPHDQQELKKAYNFAVENGTNLKNVEEAAFYLAVQRHKEARASSGTEYFQHIPEQNQALINAAPEDRAQELEKLLIADPDNKFLQTVKRAEQGPFFGTDNPILNQELFTSAVDKHLGAYSLKKVNKDTTNSIFDFLHESDKVEVEKAYREASEKALRKEDVKKAAFLLAIERLNDSVTKNLEDDVQFFQSRVDSPTKLIELARHELDERTVNNFLNVAGQPINKSFFGENKTLQQPLFIRAAARLLSMKEDM